MPISRHKKYSVNIECDIAAEPAAVFDALTRNTNRWDYYAIELHGTEAGSPVTLRDEDGNTAPEQLLAFQQGKLFARTEHRYDATGEQFLTQVYFYLSKTDRGTRVHMEQSGYDDMMLCEQDKLTWHDTLANLKAVCENKDHECSESQEAEIGEE